MPLLFVYGSLKAGFPNAHVNTGTRRPGRFRTRARLPMYLLGDGHVPCIALSPGTGHQVHGEVYDVDDQALAVMDRLERLGEPTGYARVAIEVEAIDAQPPTVLSTFVYAKSPDQVALEARRVGPLVEYTSEHAARFNWQGAA